MVYCANGCFLLFGGIRLFGKDGGAVLLSRNRGTCFKRKGISDALPDSTIENNVIGVYRDDVAESHDTVKKWLNEIGY